MFDKVSGQSDDAEICFNVRHLVYGIVSAKKVLGIAIDIIISMAITHTL